MGIKFTAFRNVIMMAGVLSQAYLFYRFQRAIRFWRRSRRFKSWAIATLGLAMVLLFAANLYIVFIPIPWAEPRPAEIFLFVPPAVWGLGSIFSALLLGLSQLLGWLGQLVGRSASGPGSPGVDPQAGLDRRYFLQVGVGSLVAAPLIISGYGAVYASKALEVREHSLRFGRSLRVVQLSDIHAGIYMTREEIRRIVDRVIALQPDLFVLTGDYISNSMKFLPGCVEEMARVRARYGTFASMGNHDHWYGDPAEILTAFRQRQITFLLNDHRLIQTEQGPLAVAGIDDLISGRPDLEAALAGLDSVVPTILLSHRPEIFPRASEHGISLTLSGHYHGGQIALRLPGVTLSISHLWTPYPEGMYRLKDCHLYVSRGIGTTFTPVRLNARPEVTLFRLT
jgi:predicted MPP superfamily phosphohydrolase